MIEAHRLSFTEAKEYWKGRAENIAVIPGLLFELEHFQGQKDGAVIAALITDSLLHVRTLWPRDMVTPPADAEPGEMAQAEFRAVDWGKDSEKRFCRMESIGGKKWN